MKIGVIGIGAMGLGVVESLRRSGFETYVRDIVSERMTLAENFGAKPCSSPSAVAGQSQIVILLVVNAEQVETVLFGKNGADANLNSESVVVVSSTLAPSYVEDLSKRLAQKKVLMLDAPVSGGPARAAAGTMTMMLSGDPIAYDRCKDVFAAITGNVFNIGSDAGMASKMKLVNNLLAGVNVAAAAEAMALAIRVGLDPRMVFDVVNESSGASWMFRDRMARVLQGDYSPRAAIPILTKDLGLAADMAGENEFPLTIGLRVHEIFSAASKATYGDEDDAALIKHYQAKTGIKLPEGK
jgi:L-threonate 2-dehydrogenase